MTTLSGEAWISQKETCTEGARSSEDESWQTWDAMENVACRTGWRDVQGFSTRQPGSGKTGQGSRALEILTEELAPYVRKGYARKTDVETASLKASRRILAELGGM